MAIVIEAENLGRDFREGFLMRRKVALESVSFALASGCLYGFLGPNGAGKSTTMHLLMGFLKPSRGKVTVQGRSAWAPEARRSLGFLPENFAFDRFSTGRGLLQRFDALAGRPVEGREKRVQQALEAVDLVADSSRRVGGYSKGMTQRIGLAQALLGDPDLLILDEPMSGMDPATRLSVRTILLSRRDRGKTTLFSSHILPDVEATAERVLILDRGRVVTEGSLEDLGTAGGGCSIVFRDGAAERWDPFLTEAGVGRIRVGGEEQLHRVDVRDAAAKNRIIATLAGGGADIVSVTPRRSSLESVFLRLTGGQPRSSEGDPPSATPVEPAR